MEEIHHVFGEEHQKKIRQALEQIRDQFLLFGNSSCQQDFVPSGSLQPFSASLMATLILAPILGSRLLQLPHDLRDQIWRGLQMPELVRIHHMNKLSRRVECFYGNFLVDGMDEWINGDGDFRFTKRNGRGSFTSRSGVRTETRSGTRSGRRRCSRAVERSISRCRSLNGRCELSIANFYIDSAYLEPPDTEEEYRREEED